MPLVELPTRLVLVTVVEAAVVVWQSMVSSRTAVKAVSVRITHSDSHTSALTVLSAPGHGSGSGIVVWSAMLVRTVMNAELELGLGAEALGIAGATAKGGPLAEHVGGTCFLAEH